MTHLGSVKMLPAREQVINILREAILTKELQEGTRLTLSELSSNMGVSVTPIREALQALDKECLIKLEPHKEAVVLGINEKYIKDYYVTRAILESEAAGMVCEKDVDTSEIKGQFEEMKSLIEQERYEDYAEMNQRLHMAIWEAAGNERMKGILISLWISKSVPINSDVRENAKVSFEEHKEIIGYILAKNKEKAKKFMYEHIIRSMEDMLTRFR